MGIIRYAIGVMQTGERRECPGKTAGGTGLAGIGFVNTVDRLIAGIKKIGVAKDYSYNDDKDKINNKILFFIINHFLISAVVKNLLPIAWQLPFPVLIWQYPFFRGSLSIAPGLFPTPQLL